MKQLLLVFLGGGVGSALRYLVGRWTEDTFALFPFGTFLVNVIGCLIIGIILGVSLKFSSFSQNTVLLVATGFCGGFTTFSAFAYENYALLKNGDYFAFSLYTFGSLALGFGAVIIGLWISRLI